MSNYRNRITTGDIAECLPSGVIFCVSVRQKDNEMVSLGDLRRSMATYTAMRAVKVVTKVDEEADANMAGVIQCAVFQPKYDKEGHGEQNSMVLYFYTLDQVFVDTLTPIVKRIEHFDSALAFEQAFELLLRDEQKTAIH